MRSVAIACAAALLCGCGDATVLRITVEPGVSPAPASLVVTLVGDGLNVPPRTIASPTFPGTIVVHGIPSGLSALCVEIDGLDDAGNVIGGASATAMLVAHRTNTLDVTMSNAFERCTAPPADDLGVQDLAFGDGGGPPADLAGAADMTTVLSCPPGALFCDDFELGNLSRWSSVQIKYADMGTVAPSMAHAAHGIYAGRATGSGMSGMDNYIELEKDFAGGLAPPLAIRANVWTATPLDSYTMVLALYDNTTNGFSVGGDNNATWVLTENQTLGGAPDRHSTLATPGPSWHCVEFVVDAGGNVSVYVDSNRIIGPFARISAVAYTGFFFGIPRTVVANTDVFIDDVAIGPSRLYCPP